MSRRAPGLDQAFEHSPAKTIVTCLFQYRHAADVSVGKQSPGTHRPRAAIDHAMNGFLVPLVPFEFERNALLAYEDFLTHAAGVFSQRGPCARNQADGLAVVRRALLIHTPRS